MMGSESAAGQRLRRREIGGLSRAILNIVLIAWTVMTVFPLVWLGYSSFKTTQEFQINRLGLPHRWVTLNYPIAWKIGNFGQLFGNSLFYTIMSTIAIIILSLAASFAFAKIKSKATPILHGSFVIGILLSLQSLMIPIYLMVKSAGLDDTRLGVLIPYVGLGLPIGIYLCTEYIRGIPDALVESARIDGASYYKIFSKLIIPMTRPVITTVAIMSVTGIWNEFMLINIIVSRSALKSLPVGIMMFSGTLASDWGKQLAALVIGLVPMVVFYLIFRNQITRGMAAGAVKG